jgi:hypothetical protein
MMICTMREVKVREDEYDLVNDLLSRIRGLPASLSLARRERRLLARGRLLLQDPAAPRLSVSDLVDSPSHRSGRADFGVHRRTNSNRHSRLFEAVRQHSRRTSESSSDSTFTASSSSTPLTPISHEQFLPDQKNEMDAASHGSLLQLHVQATTIQVFVFSDLVLLASPIDMLESDDAASLSTTDRHSPPPSGAEPRWQLLDLIGLSRVLGVQRAGTALMLDLLPIDIDLSADPPASVTSLALAVPAASSSGAPLDVVAVSAKWAGAFGHCASYTLRALAFPNASFSGGGSAPWAGDGTTMLALLTSGLPLPKSPSMQVVDIRRGRGGDAVQQEREERGWWALRFRDVLRETLGGSSGLGAATFGMGALGLEAGTHAISGGMSALGMLTPTLRGRTPTPGEEVFAPGGDWWRPNAPRANAAKALPRLSRLVSLSSVESLAFGPADGDEYGL